MVSFKLVFMPAGACLAMLLATGAQAQAPAAAPPTPPSVNFAKAKPGDLRVFMSGALRPAIDPVMPQIEAAVGRPVIFEVKQARAAQETIEAGADFDVALLTKPAMEALAGGGKVVSASLAHLGDNPLGISARGDLSKVDVKTPDALKRTMLGAKAIRRFHGAGATVPLTDHMIKELGVGEGIKDKVNAPGAPRTEEAALAPGEYALDFTLRSEISPRPGWTYLGTVPDAVRLPNVMTAGISPDGNAEHAAKLIAFLRTPAFKNALAAAGMEPL